jgi:hypothetical protein
MIQIDNANNNGKNNSSPAFLLALCNPKSQISQISVGVRSPERTPIRHTTITHNPIN